MCLLRVGFPRDEWAEAIQMVAESLAKQEEEGILCSPTSQIENVNEEEMDTSTSQHKRKVRMKEHVSITVLKTNSEGNLPQCKVPVWKPPQKVLLC